MDKRNVGAPSNAGAGQPFAESFSKPLGLQGAPPQGYQSNDALYVGSPPWPSVDDASPEKTGSTGAAGPQVQPSPFAAAMRRQPK